RRRPANNAVPSVHSTAGAAVARSSATPAGRVSYSRAPTRRISGSLFSRSPISEPGLGVLTISLMGSVVRIHSDTLFDSALAKAGAPVSPTSSSASDQYGVKPVSHVTALGRTLLV